MQKYIYFITVLFLFASCENEIPFSIKDNPPKLIINALFDTNKEKNEIALALTGREKITLIKEASVDIYVNGKLKDHLTAPDPEPNEYYVADVMYKTKLRFAPGDVIKIEAKTNDGKYHAWAEVVVPQLIPINKIDTAIVTKHVSEKFLRTKTNFTDNGKQTNYYRLTMCYDLEIETKSPSTHYDTIIYKTITEPLMMNEDVVLTDGHPYTENDEDGMLPPIENKLGVFDNSRIKGSYTMTTSMRIPYSSFERWDGKDWDAQIKRIGVKVKVNILSISKTQYHYFRALNIYDSVDYDDYFNFPVKFPSNIEGGTGIFGVSIGNESVISLEDYIPYP